MLKRLLLALASESDTTGTIRAIADGLGDLGIEGWGAVFLLTVAIIAFTYCARALIELKMMAIRDRKK